MSVAQNEKLFAYVYESVKKLFYTTDDYFILVDGLSLMLEVSSNKHLKWYENGGICLSFVYLLERYLAMLLKLKSFIKFVFFKRVEHLFEQHTGDEQSYLTYELTLFHLKTLPQFRNNILFFDNFSDYLKEVKSDRVNTIMVFSHTDVQIPDKSLNASLSLHLVDLAYVSLDLGLNVILTKNLWHDTDCVNAFILHKPRDLNIDVNLCQKFDSLPTECVESIDIENVNRTDIYHRSFDGVDDLTKHLLLIHINLLERISLNQRSNVKFVDDFRLKYEEVHRSIVTFKSNMARVLRKVNETIPSYDGLSANVLREMCDLFDARLFYKLVELVKSNGKPVDELVRLSMLKSKLYENHPPDIENTLNKPLISKEANKTIKIAHHNKLENELFSRFLGEFEFVDDDGDGESRSTISRIGTFITDYDLNEFRQIVDSEKLVTTREASKYARYLENYSKSFKFDYSKESMYDLLTRLIEMPVKTDKMKSVDKTLYTANMEKYNDAEKKDQKLLTQVNGELAKMNDLNKSLQMILQSLSKSRTFKVKYDLFKQYLNFLLKKFQNIPNQNRDEKIEISLVLYQSAEGSLRAFRNEPDLIKELKSYYVEYFKLILDELKLENTVSENFDFKFLRFQLNEAEFSLHREYKGSEDGRVDFVPDAWQIELMDAIDLRKTVIVSAPTSSGKTFASFYAIESVLRNKEKPKSLVVYVAPTKALVNQMLAGVYSRFKSHDPGKNRQLTGVFTRDHNQNIRSCRVLLTVPECLEIIFYSTEARHEIVQNIDYIIFDEFQTINQEQRGKIIERVVLSISCPFLALSATIGNPHIIHDWLVRVKGVNSPNQFADRLTSPNSTLLSAFESAAVDDDILSQLNEIESILIKINAVFNPIRKLKDTNKIQKIIEILRADPTNHEDIRRKLLLNLRDIILIEYKQSPTDFVYYTFDKTLEDEVELCKFSPLQCLEESGKNTRHIVEGISLTPSETYNFYSEIKRSFEPTSSQAVFETSLTQSEPFRDKSFVTRNDVRDLETDLKARFLDECAQTERKENYGKFIQNIRNDAGTIFKQHKSFRMSDDLPRLVEHLKEKDMLPCLVFSFSINKCEKAARELCKYFSQKEQELRESSKYKKLIEKLEDKREKENAMKKRTRDQNQQQNPNQDEREIVEQNDYSILDNYLDECVIGDRRRVDREKLDERLEEAFDGDLDDWRCEAIRRGFCYHHSGLNSKKRVLVESLFRDQYLKLIFCTSTLAQGIHVPCKTVIFLDKSVFLDAGTFKQCAGRAGRRGFDNHGSCIFLNIPEIIVKQLVSSKAPDIKASFILSPTFILKCFGLFQSEPVPEKLLPVLEKSFLMHLNSNIDTLLAVKNKFYFLFCVQFLYENCLIDLKGHPVGLHHFTTFFQYHEPSNFVLNYLIRTGALKLIQNDERKLLILLSYLYNRLYLIENALKENDDDDEEYSEDLPKTNNSKVKLDSFPEELKEPLASYNDRIDALFKINLREQYDYIDERVKFTLPLSNCSYYPSVKREDSSLIDELLIERVSSSPVETKLVSTFSALSGFHDHVGSFHIKDKSVLIHLNNFYLDYVNLYPTMTCGEEYDFYGHPIYLNSYLLDFYTHGSYKSIIDENGLRDDVAYRNLENFKKILDNLARMKSYEPIVDLITNVKEQFSKLFANADFGSSNGRNGAYTSKFNSKLANNKAKKFLTQKPRLRIGLSQDELLLKSFNLTHLNKE